MRKLMIALMMLAMLTANCLAEGNAAFSDGKIALTLPAGLVLMENGDKGGYEAAVQADFPGASEIIMMAASADMGKAVTLTAVESNMDGLSFAREAAAKILGSESVASEFTHGEKSGGQFACAVGEIQFSLHFISGGETMYIIGASGLDPAEMDQLLGGISF